MGNNPKFNLNLRNHLIKGESAGERFEQAARSISSVSSVSQFHSPSSPSFQQKLIKTGVINDEVILFEDKK
jgi:hypothetical protein